MAVRSPNEVGLICRTFAMTKQTETSNRFNRAAEVSAELFVYRNTCKIFGHWDVPGSGPLYRTDHPNVPSRVLTFLEDIYHEGLGPRWRQELFTCPYCQGTVRWMKAETTERSPSFKLPKNVSSDINAIWHCATCGFWNGPCGG